MLKVVSIRGVDEKEWKTIREFSKRTDVPMSEIIGVLAERIKQLDPNVIDDHIKKNKYKKRNLFKRLIEV